MQLYPVPRLFRLILLIFVMGYPFLSANAGLFGTEQVIEQQQIHADKLKIQAALEREDVKQILLNHGVSQQQAQQRIDQLTDQEINQLANKFEQLPAGAGAGVLLLLSGPVMLLLEYMGMTDLTTAF